MNKLSAASGNCRRTNERTDGRTEEVTNERRTDERRDKQTDARRNEGIINSTAQYSQETRSAETSDCRTNNQKRCGDEHFWELGTTMCRELNLIRSQGRLRDDGIQFQKDYQHVLFILCSLYKVIQSIMRKIIMQTDDCCRLDEMRCIGNEYDISECKSSDWMSPSNCNHMEDASI
ncbi:hypothetical protein DPMN_024405 [Dreissena polymorpha]|uniref:SRCR domain-containing protein n=1 Tax=Dreissena polymorpha TaxID=45954 RepID=A0A9D4LNU7_DREPO|nr:hypothetical protein DPMN_024405 [Dreissena polymorpha]